MGVQMQTQRAVGQFEIGLEPKAKNPADQQ